MPRVAKSGVGDIEFDAMNSMRPKAIPKATPIITWGVPNDLSHVRRTVAPAPLSHASLEGLLSFRLSSPFLSRASLMDDAPRSFTVKLELREFVQGVQKTFFQFGVS